MNKKWVKLYKMIYFKYEPRVFPKKPAVYQIKNLLNDRIYIGSSFNFYKRMIAHFFALKNGTHKNDYLQNDWNNCGEENFCFILADACEKQSLREIEQEYLDKHYDNQNMCYNMSPSSEDNTGHKHTNETKRKISLQKKGKKLNPEAGKRMSITRTGKKCHTKERKEFLSEKWSGSGNPAFGKHGSKSKSSKKVAQYTLEGIFMKEHGSIIEASQITNTCKTSISGCCNGKLKTAGNYKWSFTKDLELKVSK